MLKSYKTEINPSDEQKHIIQKTIGTCRFVYNFYWLITKKFTKKKNSLCQDRFGYQRLCSSKYWYGF